MLENISSSLIHQRAFFYSGETKSYSFRLNQLKTLQALIKTHDKDITEALYKDLHKSESEAFVSEIALVNKEIEYVIKNLKKWMKPISTPSLFPICWPGKSQIIYEPFGIVLILSPWNYPFYLCMMPLIGAIASGNCVILKPSEIAPHTQNLIIDLINSHFDPAYCLAVAADATQTETLLKEKYDYIFYTGSTNIGKKVMQAAAHHLTPLTLELGGKSPAIIDDDVNLDFAVRRLMWAKFLNAGQTCIAPDYVYVPCSLKSSFLQKCNEVLLRFYGDNKEQSKSYARIINIKQYERLHAFLEGQNIVLGGETNAKELYIAPTLIDGVTWQDPMMQEEIFGPILPIIEYDDLNEVITHIKAQEKPLALYYFTNNKKNAQHVLETLSFGGGCINDCLLHITNYHLPFGGIGNSGFGSYHGRFSFETLSHRKSIFKRHPFLDLPLTYPPYTEKKLRWLKWLI